MIAWIESNPWLFATILAGALAALALVRGILLGYPKRTLDPSVLSDKEQAILSACADALFPTGGALPLSGTEAGVLVFFDDMLKQLPRQNRLLIRALLQLLEHGPWIVNLKPRLTAQSPSQRVETLRAWSTSQIYLLRTAFIGIRALLTMAYLENHDVACRVGHLPDLDPFARKAAA